MNNHAPILVAEDCEDDVFLLQAALTKSGVPNPLIVASDGQEAMDYLKGVAEANLPGLFILDLKMPRRDGFEVLEWLALHPKFRQLPTIVLTSSTHKSDMRRALQLGARGFYVKPNELRLLAELLQRLYLRWLQPRQQSPEMLGQSPSLPGSLRDGFRVPLKIFRGREEP